MIMRSRSAVTFRRYGTTVATRCETLTSWTRQRERTRGGAPEAGFCPRTSELGKVLDCLGRFEEAEVSIRTALRLEPEHAIAHSSLGHTLYHLGAGQPKPASYRAALRLRPRVLQWHLSLRLRRFCWPDGSRKVGRSLNGAGGAERIVRRRSHSSAAAWNGEARKRGILLLADQGLGERCSSAVMSRRSPHAPAGPSSRFTRAW